MCAVSHVAVMPSPGAASEEIIAPYSKKCTDGKEFAQIANMKCENFLHASQVSNDFNVFFVFMRLVGSEHACALLAYLVSDHPDGNTDDKVLVLSCFYMLLLLLCKRDAFLWEGGTCLNTVPEFWHDGT